MLYLMLPWFLAVAAVFIAPVLAALFQAEEDDDPPDTVAATG